ncbi:type II 3-dehydroquinate dehydratase [Actinomadura opuntiae]|uniref:type II 3-dehydroquinate dehydratase n=1 Tax=Actinomadura sp. OS1-43 TaxID=604315 RepID=UPI00255B2A22|nr:type II 3-dehydroquinate dehydratase [Actinomadura sp. OS1-43]MDL4814135.1 type II 3-dehydroquinate dehydratase [Actinomadura sp. OS1-43]
MARDGPQILLTAPKDSDAATGRKPADAIRAVRCPGNTYPHRKVTRELMHVGVVNGPNLNRLGQRRPDRYGRHTLADILAHLQKTAARLGVRVSHIQSNHEGELVDWLHEHQDDLDALIVNPAGLTPYGKPLYDALSDTGLPVAVVHITQLYRHEGTDARDLFRGLATAYIAGLGWRGYGVALENLCERRSDGPDPA